MLMADKLKKKPELFYAHSILGNKNITKNEREINFANLNKGFYDDLVNKDTELKANKDLLKQVKSIGIKESIYCNKPIPTTWKNKIGYYSDLYKTMSQDPNFINYLGRTSKDSVSKQNKEEHHLNTRSLQPTIEIPSQPNEAFETNKLPISSMITSKNQTLSSLSRKKTALQANNFANIEDHQKYINNILEEYKTAYPLQLKSEAKNHLPKLKTSQNESLSSSIYYPSTLSKKEVFKSTIYSNLLPDKANPLKKQVTNFNATQHQHQHHHHHLEKKSDYGTFLNSNSDAFNKSVEITNPKIKTRLIDLDYWGPYFSHCPSCRNKNFNFYETMEPNQCLKLLNYLKKTRCDLNSRTLY